MSEPAITASGLAKSYGDVHALDGIDLEAQEATVLGLLGPNGAGKTTAVRPRRSRPPRPRRSRRELARLHGLGHRRHRQVRALWLDAPADNYVWGAFAWSIAMILVFPPLAVRAYRRAAVRA